MTSPSPKTQFRSAPRPGKQGGKRDENRRKQIDTICSAGLALFCQQGVTAVTIDEIVREAGIAKGSFYRYFANKAELVQALFSPIASAIQSALSHAQSEIQTLTTPNELSKMYNALAGRIAVIIANHQDILQLYLQENRGPAIGARAPIVALSKAIEDAAVAMTSVAQQHGLLRDDYDARLGSLASIGAAERLMLAHRKREITAIPADISTELIHIILDGVR